MASMDPKRNANSVYKKEFGKRMRDVAVEGR